MTRRLSRLYRGSESSIQFNLLIEGVVLRSEPMRAALEDYLVHDGLVYCRGRYCYINHMACRHSNQGTEKTRCLMIFLVFLN